LNVTGELLKAREKLESIERKSGELTQMIDRRLP